jgi:hypothetical protein
VQSVGASVLDGCGDAVEQFTDLVDSKWYQSGLGLDTGAPFSRGSAMMTRNAAAAMDSVMCRYHEAYSAILIDG